MTPTPVTNCTLPVSTRLPVAPASRTPESRLADTLVWLRAHGIDVRTAYDQAEARLRQVEIDVPVRKGAVGL